MTSRKIERAKAIVSRARGPLTRGRVRSLLLASGFPASEELINEILKPAKKSRPKTTKEAGNG